MLKTFRLQSFQFAEPDKNGEVAQDIQVFKSGVFSYWEPGDMTMSREMFNSMIVNFQNKARGCDLAVDYSHNAYAEAAGWIKELYLKEDNGGCELWAKVDWTATAKKKIADKEYRYISGEFSYEYENDKGVKCGPTLFGAALTNRPFLKEMEPVIDLNEKNKEMIKMNEEVKKLNEEIAGFKVQLSEKDAEIAKLKGEILASEKKAAEEKLTLKFNDMLKEGKVCEAQREAYMSNDVVKFSELSKPVNLSAQGTSEEPAEPVSTESMTREDAENKILELAEAKTKDGMSFSDAIKEALKENPEIAKKYRS